ncbi:hypothetical protein BGZ92_008413 [Podila epicladia]|nr:hypothetical protein BGZ92_008413 [Podila epicladia]
MTQPASSGTNSGAEKAEIRPSLSLSRPSNQRQGYRHFDPSASSSTSTNTTCHQKSEQEDTDLARSSTSSAQRPRVLTFQERISKESPLPRSLPPPPPPPHDYDDTPVQLQHLHLDDEKDDSDHKLPPLPPTPSPPPPPLPSKRTFYQNALNSKNSSSTPAFIEAFMARHPRISRHRRRFAALIFTIVTLLLLLIVLLSVLLHRKGDDLGDYGDGTTATDEELERYNRGKKRPPINHSKDDRWARRGQGEGTYYDPSVKISTGDFVMGACEFPFINSVHDMIAALNKPDFGLFPRAMNSPACGQCIRVMGPNGTVDVQIVDMCPGCKSGDVDLSPGAFSKIAHLDTGRIPISWQV